MHGKAVALLAASIALPLASAFHGSGIIHPRLARAGSIGRLNAQSSPQFASARRGYVSKLSMTASVAPTTTEQALAPEDEWIAKLDYAGFKKEVAELGKRMEKNQGKDDVDHIKKICLWSNTFAAIGLATMWLPPNPITVMALSLWTFSRWTTIAHHTGHGGYNRADETKYFNSRGFATGSLYKRVTEWFDWMLPEAWNIEHNNLHHYRLGERADPDFVERNLEFTRQLKAPMFVKYAIAGFLMVSWKWFYYAPNTYKELKIAELRKLGKPVAEGADNAFTVKSFVDQYIPGEKPNLWYSFGDLMKNVLGPYLLIHFFLMPLPFLLLSTTAYTNAVASLFLADIVTNIHSFIVIATNHAGSDMYKFESGCVPNSATFFMRQVVSSVNFRTGGDWNDFMHGFLNYQIEHHVWPNLSALSYQRAQPELKAICERYGVPYVQESVWVRLRKTVDVMVGLADNRPFPAHLERPADLKVRRRARDPPARRVPCVPRSSLASSLVRSANFVRSAETLCGEGARVPLGGASADRRACSFPTDRREASR